MPILPAVIIVVMVGMAVLAPVLSPHSPTSGILRDQLKPPMWLEGGSGEYPLGTDRFGRDILSRMMHGARISLIVSLVSLAIGATVGATLGLISGYLGRWVDALIMRIVDMTLSLPLFLMAIVLAVILGPNLLNVIIIVAFLIWARYARIIRGEVLSLRSRDFVALARVAGASHTRIIVKHLFPNVAHTLVILITLQVGWVILLESSLSFLGVGIPPPTPAWGLMVADGRNYVDTAWWISVVPGIAIALIVLSLNLAGDWLRDVLDPRRRQMA
ncbi:MAG: ABC transporter permease [Chloroflexi bacterium]|nr:ABC transporter permease [Chloroflexota bacterium]